MGRPYNRLELSHILNPGLHAIWRCHVTHVRRLRFTITSELPTIRSEPNCHIHA